MCPRLAIPELDRAVPWDLPSEGALETDACLPGSQEGHAVVIPAGFDNQSPSLAGPVRIPR